MQQQYWFGCERASKSKIYEHILNTSSVSAHYYSFPLFALIFMVPFNLFALHCSLFSEVPNHLIFDFVSCFIISAVYVFVIGVLFADISFQIIKSFTKLNRFIFNCKYKITFSLWIKALNCLDRIGNWYRKVAFTCGDFYYVSYATVISLVFVYIRFFLLTHKKSMWLMF